MTTINIPNLITVSRVVLALFTLACLFTSPENQKEVWYWTAFVLTAIVIWADGLDGYFARKLNQCTKLGGILDIASDRAVELAYWIVFSTLGWIPVFVPLTFLIRGTFVDAIRAHASEQGKTAFGAKTMMETPLGKFLVASNFSRFTYAVVKALAFCLVIASRIPSLSQINWLAQTASGLVWASVVFCLIRGIPVLYESENLFKFEKPVQ